MNNSKSHVKGMTACRAPEDDYISRQEAIDVCMKYNGQGYVWSCIMGDLRKLPSAKPERCEDCENFSKTRLLIPQPEVAKDTDVPSTELISRQAAIDEITEYGSGDASFMSVGELKRRIEYLPSAQTEACEYYALCRHGRDENKLRARFVFCEYCNEDTDGFVTPLEKNGHAFVRFGINGWELSLKANGWHGSAKIRYCPMCGRDLLVK